ncbi:hypothetical protein GDO86_014824 [Hymenochirus boettgeri]|uniref:Uncharacterized protein n=1 Tax=Hymenochirus boettgeri TaxID=247094 RepID=A0A8T2JQ97_9PIPI|nr:hypothetical protein GDO86_014824 [Hymenochirus boettgeri]
METSKTQREITKRRVNWRGEFTRIFTIEKTVNGSTRSFCSFLCFIPPVWCFFFGQNDDSRPVLSLFCRDLRCLHLEYLNRLFGFLF